MSDRFDITLERKLESSADGGERGGASVRRIELITGVGRRRTWSDDDKARIIVESLAPGANVSEVARRSGLSPQQLFAWRREARALFREGGSAVELEGALRSRQKARPVQVSSSDEAPAFAQVVMAVPASSSVPPPSTSSARSGTIEIALGDTVVRVVGEVETAALAAVLAAVRRAS